MNITVITFSSVLLYLISSLYIATRLFRANDSIKRLPGLLLGSTAVTLHASLLYTHIMTDSGVNFGLFNTFSLVLFTIAFLLLLSSLNKPIENLAIALFPIAAIALIGEYSFDSERFLPKDAPWGLNLHIMVSITAYSILALASMQAILLAIQDKHLHNRHPGGFIRALPPLQTMEALLFEMIAVGFTLLSIALMTGFIFLEDLFAQRLAHKTILSIIAWFLFGTLLWGRFKFGWRGQQALRWTLVGFIVLMLGYFGSKIVYELVFSQT